MSHIFVAHVEEDADIALGIALGLEEAGFRTWIYEIDSFAGPSYLIQTGNAVAEAEVIVVIISPNSVGSRQVTKEIVRAHESGKEFIPILRDVTHIEFQNRQPEWREALGSAASINLPPEGVEDILPRIIGGITLLGIKPGLKAEEARIALIYKAMGKVLKPTKKIEAEAVSIKSSPTQVAQKSLKRKRWVIPVSAICAIIALSIVIWIISNRSGRPTDITPVVSTTSSQAGTTPTESQSAPTAATQKLTLTTDKPSTAAVPLDKSMVLWFPFIDNAPAKSASDMISTITVRSLYTTTHAFIDLNYNNVVDLDEPNAILEAGQEGSFKNLPIDRAVKLVSDHLIDAFYSYKSSDYGSYDDSAFAYSACPPGNKFTVPFGEFIVIGATKDSTHVNVNGKQLLLNIGQITQDVATKGSVVAADKPIVVMVFRNDKDSQDNSYATELLPESEYGTEFWLPARLKTQYKDIQSDNQEVYLAYSDGKVETIYLTSLNNKIISNEPATAYCLFDVYAKDPWGGKMRHYTHSYPLPAISSLGKEYIIAGGIISTHDNNMVLIDSDFDGVFEDKVVLNAGDEHNSGVDWQVIGHVKGEYPILVRFILLGIWSDVNECTMGRIVYPSAE